MSVRFVADENLDNDIVLGLRRRLETVDIARVQDVGLRTADDPAVLQWAADSDRVLVTHDLRTIPGFAHARVVGGLPIPGVVLVASSLPVATAIDELAMIADASDQAEWAGRVVYLPLR